MHGGRGAHRSSESVLTGSAAICSCVHSKIGSWFVLLQIWVSASSQWRRASISKQLQHDGRLIGICAPLCRLNRFLWHLLPPAGHCWSRAVPLHGSNVLPGRRGCGVGVRRDTARDAGEGGVLGRGAPELLHVRCSRKRSGRSRTATSRTRHRGKQSRPSRCAAYT